MPIWLKNLQSCVRFREHLLRLQCNFILHLVGASRYDVSVVCMDSESIRNLNTIYRHVDRATDVLAFPYHEVWNEIFRTECDIILQDVQPGLLPVVCPDKEHDYNLGDVILGMSVISDECDCEGVKMEQRLPVIFTHGLCHLLGYQHNTAKSTDLVSDNLLALAHVNCGCVGVWVCVCRCTEEKLLCSYLTTPHLELILILSHQ